MTIGVSIIARNEEACIRRCLESVLGFDELVVLDTGSTDKTVNICRNYTDKVIADFHVWNDDFAEARNIALKFATTDWIFTIDADNYLVCGGLEKLRDAVRQGGFDAFRVKCTAQGGASHHFLPLLYQRREDIYWMNAVHNYLHTPGGLGTCEAEIIYSYSINHKKDLDRSLRILLREVEKSRSARTLFYLAREYSYRKDHAAAVPIYEEQVAIDRFGPQLAEGWYQLARSYKALNRITDARKACLEVLNLNANFKAAILLLAEMTGPGNSKRWREVAETATNKGLLFVRNTKSTSKAPISIYYSKDMKFFGERAQKLCKFPTYDPTVHIKSPVWFFAMYNGEDYTALKRHEGSAFFYWHGSDITRLERNKGWQQIMQEAKGVHATFSTCRVERLRKLGITAEIHPFFFGDMDRYKTSYVPSPNPQVYTTMHPQREKEYGLPGLVTIAFALPGYVFHIYGIDSVSEALADNIKLHGWVDEETFDRETDDMQGAIKLVPTQSISQTQIKALLRGQYAFSIASYGGLEEMIKDLEKLANRDVPSALDPSYRASLNDLSWLNRG